jgi:hypothetical protein
METQYVAHSILQGHIYQTDGYKILCVLYDNHKFN